ncbi:hypothetical protein F5890DRAFT_726727 [Lentinula detonsa]|uniref:Uncharacterized protein n=1 Tax=Lentinula detonsa TaxID=2804962 RepID=A0AA38PSC1_9AGAR|nr:hypothetical protein F5890DRAFT_726727 [Lentinula detonsa]
MHLSTIFLVFGLASVACAAPRAMNAKARNAGLDIDVFRPELDNRGIPTVPVEGDTTLSGYKPLMPRQAGQDAPLEKKKKGEKKKKKKKKGEEKEKKKGEEKEKKKGEEKKVRIQEPPSAVTVQGDPDIANITLIPLGTPFNDIERIQFRIDLMGKFFQFIKKQKIDRYRLQPSNIPILYTLEGNSGAGGQLHKIVKFKLTHPKTCGAQPCRGFLNFSTGKFRIEDPSGKAIYCVGPSSSKIANLKMKNPSIPHPPAGYHRKPSTTVYDKKYRYEGY